MKVSQKVTSVILALTVFTGIVNAKMNTSTDLVNDKAVTMKLILESLKHNSLSIEGKDFQKDVKELLAQKPYTPSPGFLAFNKGVTPAKSESTEADE